MIVVGTVDVKLLVEEGRLVPQAQSKRPVSGRRCAGFSDAPLRTWDSCGSSCAALPRGAALPATRL